MKKVGAPRRFVEAHLNWVFWEIANGAPIGRKQLVKETGIGEGSMRTILGTLISYGLIDSSASGHTLTNSGERTYKKMRDIVTFFNENLVIFGKGSCVMKLSGLSKKVSSGMEQRDASVSVSDIGVTTLVQNSRLKMPGIGAAIDFSGKYPKEARSLIILAKPREGDVLIIASDQSKNRREEAAWAAASTLLK